MTIFLLVLLILMVAGGITGLFLVYRMLRNMTPMVGLDPDVAKTVHEIVSSLGAARTLASGVARDLEINVAEARQQFTRLVVLLDRLQMDMTTTGATSTRIEGAAAGLHEHLAANEEADKVFNKAARATSAAVDRIEADGKSVAKNLADVQEHARIIESAPDAPTGAAADFAAGGNDRPLPKGTRKRKT